MACVCLASSHPPPTSQALPAFVAPRLFPEFSPPRFSALTLSLGAARAPHLTPHPLTHTVGR